MNCRELALPDLPGIAKDLFSNHNIVAIIPECGDLGWAVGAAWSIARAAATTGRRTALVDLDLENPSLHEHAKDPGDTGIVDAFLFGASLQHVASQEENPNLHFIGVGTPPLDPEEVWASDRWQRLSRGFVKEKAILLVFMNPDALEKMVLEPDLFLVLSRAGLGHRGPSSPQVRAAVDRGLALAVVKDAEAATTESPKPDREDVTASSTLHAPTGGVRSVRSRNVLIATLGVVATAVAVAVTLLHDRNADRPHNDMPVAAATAGAASQPDTEAVSPNASEAAIDSSADSMPLEPGSPPAANALPYSIQVAAWTQLSQAQNHVAQFSRADIAATIAIVPRDSSRVWYRVLVGAAADYSGAGDLRRRLQEAGLIGSTRGVLLETPYALLLGTYEDVDSGKDAVRGLRESGIPAYIVSMPDGSAQVLLGAFESPDQAELTDSVFQEADRDLSRDLVFRVGIAR